MLAEPSEAMEDLMLNILKLAALSAVAAFVFGVQSSAQPTDPPNVESANPEWVAVLTGGEILCKASMGKIRIRASRDGSLQFKFGVGSWVSGSWKVAGPTEWGRELPNRPYATQRIELVDVNTIKIWGTQYTWTCRLR